MGNLLYGHDVPSPLLMSLHTLFYDDHFRKVYVLVKP